MTDNSKELPPISPALSDCLYQLISQQAPLKEHQLLKQLAEQGYSQFTPTFDPLELFRSHFLLFHILYRLEPEWRQQHQLQIVIDTLAIEFIPAEKTSEVPGLALFNQLRDYYLDYQQFIETQEQDVIDLLNNFWSGFGSIASSEEIQSAKQTLLIEEEISLTLIKQQFRKLSQQHHPDKGGCAEHFKELVHARDTLINHLQP